MDTRDLVEDRIIFLERPVRFSIIVGGRKRAAEFIWAKWIQDAEYRFKIRFSDGHEDLFELNNFEVYNQQGEIDMYTVALQEEVFMPLWSWHPEDIIQVIKHPESLEDIWIILHKGDRDYSVYQHNDLLFHLDRELGDKINQPMDNRVDENILAEILKKIP